MIVSTGELVWVSRPLPASAHDLTCAWIWGITGELASAGLTALAGKGYTGAGDPVITPYRGRKQAHLPEGRQPRPRAAARSRRARQLETLAHPLQAPLLPWRAGQIAKAIHVLQTREIVGQERLTH